MKAIVVGSINIDRVFNVKKIVKEGETIYSTGEQKFLGGKGLNQAIALSRIVQNTFFYTNLNPHNTFIKSQLEQYTFDYSLSKHIDASMGDAIIQVDKHGENAIILSPNANHLIDIEHLKDALNTFEEGDFLVLQNEINGVKDIIQIAKDKGFTIVLNPSPVTEDLSSDVIKLVDYLIVNRQELEQLSGNRWTKEAVSSMVSLYPNTELIVTLGEGGVFYYGKEGKYKISSREVEVQDTTCAGDTFLGYFIGSLIKGVPVEESLHVATKAASLCVMVKGASNSIPTKEDVFK